MVKTVHEPLFSVIINCFNGAKYLKEAINSVYRQDLDDWEIIFWDNRSTDSSAKIAQSYDKKLKYYKSSVHTNLGEARSNAIEKANGKWLAFLDTDDFWFPNKLSSQYDCVEGTNFILCYAGIQELDSQNRLIREWVPTHKSGFQLGNQLRSFEINMVTPIIKRSILIDYNISFDKNIVASEEYNLFIRLAIKGEFCSLKKILGVWRISDDSLTNQSAEYWWQDRLFTLDQLEEENPQVINEYSKELLQARHKAIYYKARWEMINQNLSEARKSMKSIATGSFIYFTLFALCYLPPLWDFFHRDNVKRKLGLVYRKLIRILYYRD